MSPSRQVGVSRGPVEPDGFFRDSAVCGIAFAFCAHDSLRTDYHGLDDTDEVMMGGADVPFEAVESLVALDAQRGIKSGKR